MIMTLKKRPGPTGAVEPAKKETNILKPEVTFSDN
jgi:hypothetical protein